MSYVSEVPLLTQLVHGPAVLVPEVVQRISYRTRVPVPAVLGAAQVIRAVVETG